MKAIFSMLHQHMNHYLHDRTIVLTLILSLTCFLSLPAVTLAQERNTTVSKETERAEKQENKKASSKTPIKRLDNHRALVGNVLVDRKSRRIEVPAEVNMTRGILEYYAVCEEGKLHEAVLKINAMPSHIHLALILAGYEPSEYTEPDPKTHHRKRTKRGSLLRLYLKWTPQELGREQWIPAEAWLYNRDFDAPPKPSPYVFTGSLIDQEGYVADRFKSVIGLIDDATVVLSPTVNPGNPYQGDQLGYEVYSSAIPPKGTAVTLVIKEASGQEIAEIAHYERELKQIQEIRRKQRIAKDKQRPLPPPPPFEINLFIDARSELSYAKEVQ